MPISPIIRCVRRRNDLAQRWKLFKSLGQPKSFPCRCGSDKPDDHDRAPVTPPHASAQSAGLPLAPRVQETIVDTTIDDVFGAVCRSFGSTVAADVVGIASSGLHGGCQLSNLA